MLLEAPTCERKRTMVFMAYDAVKSDEQCYNDTCPSFFLNANMTLHIAPKTNNEKVNIIILDSIGNLNPNEGSQTIDNDTVKSYHRLVQKVKARNFAGDFLVANSKEGDKAGRLMESIVGALKREGKYKQINCTFLISLSRSTLSSRSSISI